MSDLTSRAPLLDLGARRGPTPPPAAPPAHDLDPFTARLVRRASRDELAVRRRDRLRQVVVTAAWLVAATLTTGLAGALGSPVLQGAGGALARSATPLAPAAPTAAVAFPLALGLTAYVVWQWLPGRTGAARDRATGWWAALALALQGVWLGTVAVGSAAAGTAALLALAAVLVVVATRQHRQPAGSRLERVLVDGTVGAWLGWVLVAAVAHAAGTVGTLGLGADPLLAGTVAVGGLAVLVALGRLLAVELGAPWALAAGLAWGLLGVAVGQLAGGPSFVLGLAALAAAGAVLASTAAERRPA